MPRVSVPHDAIRGRLEATADGDDLRLIEVDWDKCDDCGLCAEALSCRRALHVGQTLHRLRSGRPGPARPAVLREVRRRRHHLGRRTPLPTGIHAGPPEGVQGAGNSTPRSTPPASRPGQVVEKALPYIDLFLLDLKSMDGPRPQGRRGGPQRADPRQRPQDRGRGRQDTGKDPRDPPVQRLRGELAGGRRVLARSSARR